MTKLGKEWTKWSFLSLIKLEKDKLANSVCIPNFKKEPKPKTGNQKWRCSRVKFEGFRVRRLDFSLIYREIRSSAVFGTRRKAALRGEGFAWVPDLGSFLKLREVGVSPYLGFILHLSTL